MTGDDRRQGGPRDTLADDEPTAAAPSDGDFPRVSREHYEMGPELARGGGGRLLRARDLRLDREVAIKEPLAFSTRIEQRFLREAVLTARLQHPSIVPVHEIGRWPTGEPFYAMKLVSGRTLRDAVSEATAIEQRVALVTNVLAVADAMAYAHDQGIVHRDLKPSNVMIGPFGETQIIDWGLAKEIQRADPVTGEWMSADPDLTDGVRGTPATMAPEQATGQKVDQRTDVYGIGALLYEVLAGVPPYGGESVAAVLADVAARPPLPLAERAPEAPRELVAIADHAMEREPARRYPSARELADDLRRFSNGQLVRAYRYSPWSRAARLGKRHRRTAVAVVTSLALGSAGALVVLRSRAAAISPCEGAGREIAGVWNQEREAAIGSALGASGKSWAKDTAELVARELTRYGADWTAMRRESCEATNVHHEQSEALLDLRTQCLDARLAEMNALATLLTRPDDTLLASAPKAVYALTPLQPCADARQLLAPVPVPRDAAERAQVNDVRAALANVKAMNELGRYAAAEPLAADLAKRARSIRYAPIEAETLEAWADSLEYVGDYGRASAAYHEALWAAERGRDHTRVASALVNLVWEAGIDEGLHEQAHDYAAHAAAVLEGLGGDTEIEGNLASYEGALLRDEGRLEESERRGREAIEKRRATFGPDHPRYAMALANVSAEIADQGRYAEALQLARQALSINARTLGEHHPDYALTLQSVASSLNRVGQAVEARPLAVRAVDIMVDALGPDHARTAASEWTLALIDIDLAEYVDAEAQARRAVTVAENARGSGHLYVAQYTGTLADILARENRGAEALALFRSALEIIAKNANAPVMAAVQSGMGLALLDMGKPADALGPLEAALRWQEKEDKNKREVAHTRFRLARALWLSGGDRRRARDLATLGLAGLEGDPGAIEDANEARAWLAANAR
jgi:tetratricopeptide (TPR) repeat protein